MPACSRCGDIVLRDKLARNGRRTLCGFCSMVESKAWMRLRVWGLWQRACTHSRLGILRMRDEVGEAVRKKSTRARVCPSLLRGVNETGRRVADSAQATETSRRASLSLLSEEIFCKTSRRCGPRGLRCQSFIATVSRAGGESPPAKRRKLVASGLHFISRVPRQADDKRTKRNFSSALFVLVERTSIPKTD